MEIAVRVNHNDVDAVSGIFDLIGTGGVVIEDPALIYDIVSRGDRETVAIDIPANPAESPLVKGYLPADGNLGERLEELRDALGKINVEYPGRISINQMEDVNWLERWKEFYHPVRVGRRLLVRPAWENVADPGDLLVIDMDPGMAFGCGTHPTTTMCMRLLEDVVEGGETVLDVGTGSGILAITAARLGAARVLAVDSDGVAVRSAAENVTVNGLNEVIQVREGNLLEGIEAPADIIVANIVADVILKLLPAACNLLKPGGKLIASGIISHRRGEMIRTLAGAGLVIRTALDEGEWTAFLAEKANICG
ncbi:MAG: 50S ribosomal protein L11 methyltransferase [Bacillota bacterium]